MNNWMALPLLSILLLPACSFSGNNIASSPDKPAPGPAASSSQQYAVLLDPQPQAIFSIPDHIARIPVHQHKEAPSTAAADAEPKALTTNHRGSVSVKGIYVSAWRANGASLAELIALLDNTELNAMVIDVKNDSGQITYDSAVSLANEIGSDDTKPLTDIKTLLAKLKEHKIYTIARVVAFKDPYLCSVRKDLAMHTKAGGIWRDKKGVAWVDPYHPDVQAYNIAIAKEAAELGFDEVQFDYVRFPENGKKVDQQVRFYGSQHISKAELISQFLIKAKSAITIVPISADVFGLTPSINDDMGIGQEWNKLSPIIDYISPMVYPSHYGDGSLGIAHPDLQPYATVRRALKDALAKNEQLANEQHKPAQVRPWLQDFTAKWVKNHQVYGTKQVRDQIRAAKELGVDQFLLWNTSGKYSYRE